MATKHDTSKARSGRNQTKKPVPAAGGAPAPADDADSLSESLSESPLVQAIEAERSQLMQAYAVLKCLSEVLLYTDDEDAVLQAESAHVAARLIDESVTRLDYVRLKPMIEAIRRGKDYELPEEKVDSGRGRKNEVRDEGVQYLC